MRRFEEYAARLLDGASADIQPLLDSLEAHDLVRLLAGIGGSTDAARYRRNLIASALLDRVHAKDALLDAALVKGEDLQALSEGVQRSLRADMSCIDEVVGDHFILHGRNRLHPAVQDLERCHHTELALCKAVLDRRAALVIPDIPADPTYRHVPAYAELGIRSYAAAPAFDEDGEIAIVVWVATYASHEYRPDELMLLDRVATRALEMLRHPARAPPRGAAPSQRL